VKQRVALAVVLALVAAGCGSTRPAAVPHWHVWLCLPGHEPNYCQQSLNTTAVFADGSSAVESIKPASKPPIDCFYVYPTVSPFRVEGLRRRALKSVTPGRFEVR
jgi:hypothetical protein